MRALDLKAVAPHSADAGISKFGHLPQSSEVSRRTSVPDSAGIVVREGASLSLRRTKYVSCRVFVFLA